MRFSEVIHRLLSLLPTSGWIVGDPEITAILPFPGYFPLAGNPPVHSVKVAERRRPSLFLTFTDSVFLLSFSQSPQCG